MSVAVSHVLSELKGREALDWMRDNSIGGGFDVLVSARPYTGRVDPEWVCVERVLQGDGAPYPIRGPVRGAGYGQWSYREVLAVRQWDGPLRGVEYGEPDFREAA